MTTSQIDDEKTVTRIASLARIKISPEEAKTLKTELNSILSWVAELNEVNTDGVQPLASVEAAPLPQREDAITDGNYAHDIVKNAPKTQDDFFLVPKVID